jgi:hypothetical protein
MRRSLFSFLSLLLLAAALLTACRARESAGPQPARAGIELRNGRWYDGGAFREKTMYVVGRNLTSARPARVEKIVDLAGGWVVPPYAEGHNHWLEPEAIGAYDAQYLRDGVFYLKDLANAPVVRRRMDAALNRPTTVDFVSANQGWSGPGAHPDQIALQFLKFGSFPKEWTEKDLDRNVVEIVETPADVEARWPEFLAGRPDFVKVFLLYSEEYAKRRSDPAFLYKRGMDPALVPIIAAKAHAAGLRVAAHAYTAADFRNALAGGVDDIAHFPGTGWDAKLGDAAFRITAEDAALAAKRGATVTTTLFVARRGHGERSQEGPARPGRGHPPEPRAAAPRGGHDPSRQRPVSEDAGRRGGAPGQTAALLERRAAEDVVRDDAPSDLPEAAGRQTGGWIRGELPGARRRPARGLRQLVAHLVARQAGRVAPFPARRRVPAAEDVRSDTGRAHRDP